VKTDWEGYAWAVFAVVSIVGIPLVWLVFLVEYAKQKQWGKFAALFWAGFLVFWFLVAYYIGPPQHGMMDWE
jgi:hypothetical protein